MIGLYFTALSTLHNLQTSPGHCCPGSVKAYRLQMREAKVGRRAFTLDSADTQYTDQQSSLIYRPTRRYSAHEINQALNATYFFIWPIVDLSCFIR